MPALIRIPPSAASLGERPVRNQTKASQPQAGAKSHWRLGALGCMGGVFLFDGAVGEIAPAGLRGRPWAFRERGWDSAWSAPQSPRLGVSGLAAFAKAGGQLARP